jgi:uncharacterized membrane protein YccC
MALPSSRDWIFSVKTFSASMLALYIALKLELPRPYWAMATVYIVSNPFVGATTSKALYRTIGTMLGAAASVALVPPLVETPYLLSAAIALWMGVMLYLSITDRTAKSYVFLLAGYTLPLIAFPTVTDPTTVFDVAVTRTEEIVLGICCASVVNTVILPNRLAPVLAERTRAWFRDAAFYAVETLAGHPIGKDILACRQRMAVTLNGLELLLSQLSYDHTRPDIVRQTHELRGRMGILLPIISSLSDPLRVLREGGFAGTDALNAVAADIAQWIDATKLHPDAQSELDVHHSAEQLRTAIAGLEPARDTLHSWDHALVSSLLVRMRMLVDLWEDCICLHHAIAEDDFEGWTPQFRHWRVGAVGRFFDHGILSFSTIIAMSAVFIACVLWIESGWEDGAAGVSLAAVACCFFAALDDPASGVFRFFVSGAVSIVAAGLYLFLVLPNMHDFAMLVIVFAVPFICVGTLMPHPRFSLMATLVALNTATFISIQSAYEADFQVFLNGNTSALVGLLFAYLWIRVTRPFGTELAARRLIRSSWEDVVSAASPNPVPDPQPMSARMLDRLLQLLPRLPVNDEDHPLSSDSFRDMRAGLNTIDLKIEREQVSPTLRPAIDRVLGALREHFGDRIARNARIAPPTTLLNAIDAALGDIMRASLAGASLDSMHTLVSLRLAVFPNTPPPASLNLEARP